MYRIYYLQRSLCNIISVNITLQAFPSISTGIYGYPIIEATHVALGTVRDFLESEAGNKVMFLGLFCLDTLRRARTIAFCALVLIAFPHYLYRWKESFSLSGAIEISEYMSA
jgi:O-acetyl-ADP-ribose deacetylase (regulator of RNase III)